MIIFSAVPFHRRRSYIRPRVKTISQKKNRLFPTSEWSSFWRWWHTHIVVVVRHQHLPSGFHVSRRKSSSLSLTSRPPSNIDNVHAVLLLFLSLTLPTIVCKGQLRCLVGGWVLHLLLFAPPRRTKMSRVRRHSGQCSCSNHNHHLVSDEMFPRLQRTHNSWEGKGRWLDRSSSTNVQLTAPLHRQHCPPMANNFRSQVTCLWTLSEAQCVRWKIKMGQRDRQIGS